MATRMQMDERSVDCLVLCPFDQDSKVSAKSVTMRATTLVCKKLSGYREFLLNTKVYNCSLTRTRMTEWCCELVCSV